MKALYSWTPPLSRAVEVPPTTCGKLERVGILCMEHFIPKGSVCSAPSSIPPRFFNYSTSVAVVTGALVAMMWGSSCSWFTKTQSAQERISWPTDSTFSIRVPAGLGRLVYQVITTGRFPKTDTTASNHEHWYSEQTRGGSQRSTEYKVSDRDEGFARSWIWVAMVA